MTDPRDPADLAGLLPFYVNGTLDPAQRSAIDAALPQSAALRSALLEEQELQARIRAETDAVLADSEPGFEARQAALGMALADQPQPEPAPAHPQAAGFLSALALLNPRRWHPAVALSLLVAVPAQAAVIATQSGKIALLQDENFQLASGPCDDRPAAGAVQLELSGQAGWSDIAELLDSEAMTISRSGGLGVLTVKTGKQGAELQSLLARLRASPLVTSAEPAA